MKKFFFPGPFRPHHSENKMQSEGDIAKSRQKFLTKRFNNLEFLLKKRFIWMNKFLKPKMKVIEIGSGSGFSKLYIKNKIILTDVAKKPWIDKKINAINMKIKTNSIDAIIVSNALHHFSSPAKFLDECDRVLKKNGVILINEPHTSFFMRLIMKIMKHEAYDYSVDVFDREIICNDKNDPWSSNCAVSELLFKNKKKFSEEFKKLTIVYQKYDEFIVFPLSGGVVSKINMIELPIWVLKCFDLLDKILITISPSFFALGRRIVIKKL